MKSPRYTAGVVSIYRKYVDKYLESGREGYRVDPADEKQLLELFDRGGFTAGYYREAQWPRYGGIEGEAGVPRGKRGAVRLPG